MRYDIRFSGSGGQGIITASDDEINYPKIVSPDIVISLTQEAYNKYAVDLKDNAVVIVDTTMVHEYDNKKHKTYDVPVIAAVSKELGSAVSANIAILGAVNEICSIVKHEWLLDVIVNNFPARAAENNKKAYNIGIELAKKALGE